MLSDQISSHRGSSELQLHKNCKELGRKLITFDMTEKFFLDFITRSLKEGRFCVA